MSVPERDCDDPFEQTARCRYLLYSRDGEGELQISPADEAPDSSVRRVLLVERRRQELTSSAPAPISIEITTRLEPVEASGDEGDD